MPKIKMPRPVVFILVAAPIVLIGATLWMANALGPTCTLAEKARETSPDGEHDLVIYSTVCSEPLPNLRATVTGAGVPVSSEARGFVALASDTGLFASWTSNETIEVSITSTGQILWQQPEVDSITIAYL